MTDTLAQNYSPYYNDFDRDKKFLQVLFKPRTPVQARELTQMQSILQEQISKLAGYTLSDGSVVSGVGATVDISNVYHINPLVGGIGVDISNLTEGTYTTSLGNTVIIRAKDISLFYIYVDVNLAIGETITTNIGDITVDSALAGTAPVVSVSDGSYFLAGRIASVSSDHIVPIPLGTNISGKVGFEYIESVITARDDSSLNDPALGTYGYSGEGADRLTVSFSLAWYDSTQTPPSNFLEIANVTNGVWNILINTPFSLGLDYTDVDLVLGADGVYTLNTTGNTNNNSFPIDFSALSVASTTEIADLLTGTGTILALVDDGAGNTVMRKIDGTSVLPNSYSATCTGTAPAIATGEYWLDTSSQPYILRQKNSTGWTDIPSSTENSFSRIECISSGSVYNIVNSVWSNSSNLLAQATSTEIQTQATSGVGGENLYISPDKLSAIGTMASTDLDSANDSLLIFDDSTNETLKIKASDLSSNVNPLSAGQTMSEWFIALTVGDVVLPNGPAGVSGYWKYIRSDRGTAGGGIVSINGIPIENTSLQAVAGVGAYAAGTSIQIPANTSPPNDETFVYFEWVAT